IADAGNNRIRKMNLSTLLVTTLAGSGVPDIGDGVGTQASFDVPTGLWGDGSNLYVTDLASGLIRKVVIGNASLTTLAGTPFPVGNADDGRGSLAAFSSPTGIWGDGNNLYVADLNNLSIRKLSLPNAAPTLTSVFPASVTTPAPGILTVGLTG